MEQGEVSDPTLPLPSVPGWLRLCVRDERTESLLLASVRCKPLPPSPRTPFPQGEAKAVEKITNQDISFQMLVITWGGEEKDIRNQFSSMPAVAFLPAYCTSSLCCSVQLHTTQARLGARLPPTPTHCDRYK